MKYKIGDKVRVRQWNDMVKEFGVDEYGNIDIKTGWYFLPLMKEFCGGVYEISSVWKTTYRLKDGNKFSHWHFVEEMLEDVIPTEPSKEIKKEDKKMKKQMTQRERLEEQLKNYQRDSDIKSIEIIVPGKIVKVTINDCLGIGTTFTMKCHKDDTFSLEKAIILAYVKYESKDLTPKGIEYEAEIFTHFKDNMKKLKKAMKVYEIQQKLKELDDEEAIVRERKRQKKIAQKQRRAERLAEEKLKETKEAAKIYADALRSAFSDSEISEDTVENIVKDMNVRM